MLLRRLKAAILDGDSREEHAIARELVGLPPEPAQTMRSEPIASRARE